MKPLFNARLNSRLVLLSWSRLISFNRNYHTGRGSTRNTYREQKPWFDDNCKKKRANFHKARKVDNLFKNDINRDQLNKTSRGRHIVYQFDQQLS
jgi:hypothetical protein